jgi:hypothetical protein
LTVNAIVTESISNSTPRPHTHRRLRLAVFVGEERPVMMPYNLEILVATYKGRLESENMLPSSGNQLGDTWVVGETPWAWIWAPGAAKLDWIDP